MSMFGGLGLGEIQTMFNKGPKLQVRLPGDAEHGPNPYDSKTPIKDLGPKWLSSWGWWVSIIVGGLGWYIARKLSGN